MSTTSAGPHMRQRREFTLPGLRIVEHEFDVPLAHGEPGSSLIQVFAREVSALGGETRPFLVYLQGGPGQESYRPTGKPLFPAWLERALPEFRILFLDGRGTGRSSPVGTLSDMAPAMQAEYLTHFRADSIVADAEFIRRSLKSPPWSIAGASFGGFCVMTYLSTAPEGVREALISGGVPSVRTPIDDVYSHTYERILERNERFYERYPGDRARVEEIIEWLNGEAVRLPDGDRLTPHRFRQLGWHLGMSDGAELLHYILERPLESRVFTQRVYRALPFTGGVPLYSVLHEACHADGFATRWSAQRMLPPAFEDSTLFTGEHIYPWMFDECTELSPLKDAAAILAGYEWGYLYNPDVLRRNDVPVAAAIYCDDPYVEAEYSQETAALTRKMRVWLTNEFEHNALRVAGPRVLDRLLGLARGEE